MKPEGERNSDAEQAAVTTGPTQIAEWRRQADAYLAGQLREHAPSETIGPVLIARSPLEGEGLVGVFEFSVDWRGGIEREHAAGEPPSLTRQERGEPPGLTRREVPEVCESTSDPAVGMDPAARHGGIPDKPPETAQPAGTQRYYVIAGQTEPNYYPAYGLSPDEALNLHLGTRFMLVMSISPLDPASLSVGTLPEHSDYDPAADARRIVDHVAPGEPITNVTIAAAYNVQDQTHVVLRHHLAGEDIYIFAADLPPGFSRRVDLSAAVAYRIHLGRVLRVESEPEEENAGS